MKTVIHYKDKPYLSVTETWIYGQIRNLRKYKPIVYCHGTDNLHIYSVEHITSLELKREIGNPWVFFNKVWNKVFKFYPMFALCLIKDNPKVIHAHYGSSGYNFLSLKKIFRIPLITTFYGYDLSGLPNQQPEWRERYKRLFDEGESFLAEGSHMKKCLIELGCPEEKIIVQHLGIDLDRIKFIPRKLKDYEEIKILIAASFREKKGIPYAIEAFGKVKQTNPMLKLKLTIIGDSTSQKTREEKEKRKILDKIEEFHLKNSINMLGYQPYSVLIEEFYKHHIFLSPSVSASDGDTEGGVPVSIIEASASGMSIISTTHCDIPEVVVNGKSGYLVPERNVNALVEKLEFLVLNPNIWGRMGLSGRKHIENHYDIKKQVQRLEEIYDRFSNQ